MKNVLLSCVVVASLCSCSGAKQGPSGDANSVMESQLFNEVQSEYDSIGNFFNGYAIVKKDGLYGIINHKGKSKVNEKYQHLELDTITECYIAELGNLFGTITANGKDKIPFMYNSLTLATNSKRSIDYYIASSKGKYGIIDENNNVIVQFLYDEIPFCTSKGFAAVKQGYYGVCDWSGNIVLDFKYDYICIFDDMPGNYRKNNKIGFIDSNLNIVTDCKFDEFQSIFVDGEWNTDYEELKILGKWGIYNGRTGEEMIPPQYDRLSMGCNENLIWAEKDGKVGFIDLSGKIIIPFAYENASDFSEGLAYVVKLGQGGRPQGGFIDKSGKVIIPFQYTAWNDSEFSEGLAKMGVSRNGGSFPDIYGFIDKTGKFVIEPKFEDVNSDFKYGYSVVKYRGSYGVINKSGEFIVPNLYDDYSFENKGKVIILKQEGKVCKFDCNGNPL
jgi:hypothetical protein